MGETPLFRLFAKLVPEPPQVLQFANRYGWMGMPNFLREDGPVTRFLQGESLHRWSYEIRGMRIAVEVWDYLKRSNVKVLRRLFHHDAQNKAILFESDGGRHVLANAKDQDPALYWAVNKKAEWIARAFLVLTITRKLCGATSHKLGLDIDRQFTYYSGPDTLLSGLWLQFYQSLIGERGIQECLYCGKPVDMKIDPPKKKRHGTHEERRGKAVSKRGRR